MSSWARRAADISSVVTSCGHPGTSAPDYTYRLEKVKFGVPLEEVCKNNDNIPGPLLVLILKLNKESPNRRDVFRAPGHQGAMKKLIHFLQSGRLVNVDNYSVYTIASVLKKFLRKIPNGIFGRSGEKELFDIIELENETEQIERLHRLFTSLPKYTQRLLVLLFGTFRVIASNATQASTGMTSEALGVSVAPSFFQSCVSDGKTARMEDVLKFKVATKIMKQIIDKFATHDLFGRENYEYYARVTGRILKVQDEWICSFQYPPPPRGKLAQQKYALQHSLEAEKTWLQCQCERWGLLAQEESRSTPALLTSSSSALENSVLSLGVTPEHSFIESCARLSVSLEGPSLFALTSSPIPKRNMQDFQRDTDNDADADEENFGDVDADAEADADDDEDEDFAAELEISNEDDDLENNLKTNFPRKTVQRNYGATTTTTTATGNNRQPTHNNAALNTTYTIEVDSVDVADSNDDEGEDEVTVVRRRYRQNKKKILTQTRMQHQRRLRAGSKSLDGGDRAPQTTPMNSEVVCESSSKMKNNKMQSSKTSAQISGDGGGGSSKTTRTRTCSRCNRGIRHSSSCSSASGGGGGGGGGAGGVGSGSGMTMEELRAVNRYAESTKSLSYLPQVHERQTARMRTRSEWFLGPMDSELTLHLPNTCSNCCLAAVQKQQQQQLQQHQHFQTHGYLGGGSTRDMRAHRDVFAAEDVDENSLVVSGSGGGRNGNALYLYYKKRLQQQKQRNVTQQQQMHAEHMDTDDSCNSYDPKQQKQVQQHLQVDATTNLYLGGVQATERRLLEPTSTIAAAHNGCGRRVYLDANTTTNIVGNIRLSNSAESIQYSATTVRRPSTRRLIGLNVPRQYPLRSSLRRHREKQVGSGSTVNNGSGNSVVDSNGVLTGNVSAVGGSGCMLPVATAPPSVRNSIAECCGNVASIHDSSQHILIPTFPFNRLEDCTSSLERKQQFLAGMEGEALVVGGGSLDDGCVVSRGLDSMLMDTTETMKVCDNLEPTFADVSGNNNLVYTTGTINNIARNLENVVSAPQVGHYHQKMAIQNQSSDDAQTEAGVSTITFKAPRV
ncbi:uncharacterized protein LOC128861111 isoform X3 [Anastrepha ludens]|uniref:uncharacterized protein LOC128861111 isoform X3 n=1 Tax=Anastrepha ludens TaxID=28586 RepID=UPI0023AF244C|nr:uncharacterized protein LOC128861111 isoform X3 [Anastrepha ludens]